MYRIGVSSFQSQKSVMEVYLTVYSELEGIAEYLELPFTAPSSSTVIVLCRNKLQDSVRRSLWSRLALHQPQLESEATFNLIVCSSMFLFCI